MWRQPEDITEANKIKVKIKVRCACVGTEDKRRYSSKSFTEFALESIAPREIDPRTDQVVASR
jgi:hypothetical protein